jgi:hypothetical protein
MIFIITLVCPDEGLIRKDWIFGMTDHLKMEFRTKGAKHGLKQSTPCIPRAAGGTGHNKRYVDVTAMVRSLQRTEGLTDCFRRGTADCDQLNCAWRQYCINYVDGVRTEDA